jgi:hypothetical protein
MGKGSLCVARRAEKNPIAARHYGKAACALLSGGCDGVKVVCLDL